MSEAWAPVVDYEDHYEVSTEGRVRRVKAGQGARAGYILSNTRAGEGYLYVNLCVDGKCKAHAVHNLVARAFLGSPGAGLEVCHQNGDREDPRLVNLRWDTHSANMLDTRLHGTNVNGSKTHCPDGHEYSIENTYVIPSTGGRTCRRCKSNQAAERYKKRKGMLV